MPIALTNVSSWQAAEAARNGARPLLQSSAGKFAVDLWTELIPINNFTAAQASGDTALQAL